MCNLQKPKIGDDKRAARKLALREANEAKAEVASCVVLGRIPREVIERRIVRTNRLRTHVRPEPAPRVVTNLGLLLTAWAGRK